jgi:hypothetical protein
MSNSNTTKEQGMSNAKAVEAFTYVYEMHSANTYDIADAIFDGDRVAAQRTLTSIFGKAELFDDLECCYVGLESDGSHPKHRNGQYLPAVWQCKITCDYGTLAESLADAGLSSTGAQS